MFLENYIFISDQNVKNVNLKAIEIETAMFSFPWESQIRTKLVKDTSKGSETRNLDDTENLFDRSFDFKRRAVWN